MAKNSNSDHSKKYRNGTLIVVLAVLCLIEAVLLVGIVYFQQPHSGTEPGVGPDHIPDAFYRGDDLPLRVEP